MEDKKNQEGGEVQENKRRKVSKEHERFDASKKAVLNITKVKDYLNNALYRIDSFKEQIISLVSEEPMVKANDVTIVDQEAAKDITVESVDKKTSEETGSTQIDSEKNLDLEKEVPAELNTIPKGVKENCDIECPTVDEPSTMESSQSTERSVNSKNKCDLTDYLIGDTDSDDDLCLPEETNSGIVITSVKPLSKALLLLNRSANIDNVTKFLENSGVQGIQDIVITKGPFLSTAVVTFDNKDNLEMSEGSLKRKREMESINDFGVVKQLKILLDGKSISLPICDDNSECFKLLNDASEAIKVAIEKIDRLEQFFTESCGMIGSEDGQSEKFVNSSAPEKENNNLKDDSFKYSYNQHWNSHSNPKPCLETIDTPANSEPSGISNNQSVELRPIDEDQMLNSSLEQPNQFQTYMDNLSKEITEEELITILQDAGLKNFAISLKHRPSHSFAFVSYLDEDNFNKALSLNKKLFNNGRKITIRVCCPQREKCKNNSKNEKPPGNASSFQQNKETWKSWAGENPKQIQSQRISIGNYNAWSSKYNHNYIGHEMTGKTVVDADNTKEPGKGRLTRAQSATVVSSPRRASQRLIADKKEETEIGTPKKASAATRASTRTSKIDIKKENETPKKVETPKKAATNGSKKIETIKKSAVDTVKATGPQTPKRATRSTRHSKVPEDEILQEAPEEPTKTESRKRNSRKKLDLDSSSDERETDKSDIKNVSNGKVEEVKTNEHKLEVIKETDETINEAVSKKEISEKESESDKIELPKKKSDGENEIVQKLKPTENLESENSPQSSIKKSQDEKINAEAKSLIKNEDEDKGMQKRSSARNLKEPEKVETKTSAQSPTKDVQEKNIDTEVHGKNDEKSPAKKNLRVEINSVSYDQKGLVQAQSLIHTGQENKNENVSPIKKLEESEYIEPKINTESLGEKVEVQNHDVKVQSLTQGGQENVKVNETDKKLKESGDIDTEDKKFEESKDETEKNITSPSKKVHEQNHVIKVQSLVQTGQENENGNETSDKKFEEPKDVETEKNMTSPSKKVHEQNHDIKLQSLVQTGRNNENGNKTSDKKFEESKDVETEKNITSPSKKVHEQNHDLKLQSLVQTGRENENGNKTSDKKFEESKDVETEKNITSPSKKVHEQNHDLKVQSLAQGGKEDVNVNERDKKLKESGDIETEKNTVSPGKKLERNLDMKVQSLAQTGRDNENGNETSDKKFEESKDVETEKNITSPSKKLHEQNHDIKVQSLVQTGQENENGNKTSDKKFEESKDVETEKNITSPSKKVHEQNHDIKVQSLVQTGRENENGNKTSDNKFEESKDVKTEKNMTSPSKKVYEQNHDIKLQSLDTAGKDYEKGDVSPVRKFEKSDVETEKSIISPNKKKHEQNHNIKVQSLVLTGQENEMGNISPVKKLEESEDVETEKSTKSPNRNIQEQNLDLVPTERENGTNDSVNKLNKSDNIGNKQNAQSPANEVLEEKGYTGVHSSILTRQEKIYESSTNKREESRDIETGKNACSPAKKVLEEEGSSEIQSLVRSSQDDKDLLVKKLEAETKVEEKSGSLVGTLGEGDNNVDSEKMVPEVLAEVGKDTQLSINKPERHENSAVCFVHQMERETGSPSINLKEKTIKSSHSSTEGLEEKKTDGIERIQEKGQEGDKENETSEADIENILPSLDVEKQGTTEVDESEKINQPLITGENKKDENDSQKEDDSLAKKEEDMAISHIPVRKQKLDQQPECENRSCSPPKIRKIEEGEPAQLPNKIQDREGELSSEKIEICREQLLVENGNHSALSCDRSQKSVEVERTVENECDSETGMSKKADTLHETDEEDDSGGYQLKLDLTDDKNSSNLNGQAETLSPQGGCRRKREDSSDVELTAPEKRMKAEEEEEVIFDFKDPKLYTHPFSAFVSRLPKRITEDKLRKFFYNLDIKGVIDVKLFPENVRNDTICSLVFFSTEEELMSAVNSYKKMKLGRPLFIAPSYSYKPQSEKAIAWTQDREKDFEIRRLKRENTQLKKEITRLKTELAEKKLPQRIYKNREHSVFDNLLPGQQDNMRNFRESQESLSSLEKSEDELQNRIAVGVHSRNLPGNWVRGRGGSTRRSLGRPWGDGGSKTYMGGYNNSSCGSCSGCGGRGSIDAPARSEFAPAVPPVPWLPRTA
ncbi:hypothetical protein AAG570_010270 [Ranatra chinensis]|uniref:RRM domain-containing protein n=1 Tax=Ranatra chinensis TaxID=642074 RepID=A0ABD0ZAE7_9HEMI